MVTDTNTDKDTYIKIIEQNNTNNDNKKFISNNDSTKGISIGVLVGIIAGAIIVIVAIILVIINRKKFPCNKEEKKTTKNEVEKDRSIYKIIDTTNMFQVRFEICNALPKTLTIEGEETVSNLIKEYFNIIKKPELFNRNDSIFFLYDAKKIAFNCNKKVKDFFGNSFMPKIVVMDTGNLIGSNESFNKNNIQKIDVIFENMNGNRKTISIEKGKTMNELFILYFQSNNNLSNRDRICFLYKNNIIDPNNQNKIENFFGYINESPIIYVSEI